MMINPKPYFTAAGGLNFESHILETEEASAIIKKEFRIENHVGLISEASLLNSLFNIQIATAQTPMKVIAKTILDAAAFLNVCFANKNNTQEIMINGTTVNKVLIILKVVNDVPSNVRSTLSRAKITNDEAPCSKAIQKKMVKNANTVTAIIRSLTTGEYLITRETTKNKNKNKPITITAIEPSIPNNSLGKIWIPPIFDNGSLNAYKSPINVDNAIKT